MIKALVGHRGVGKTSLLQRWKLYQPDYEFFDLDHEIEKQSGCNFIDFFNQIGEAEFRKVENQVFQSLTQDLDANRIISCGAGFDLSQIPDTVSIIWIRRDTDSQGRIFLDRPRLDVKTSALNEFLDRYPAREAMYLKYADQIYTMPEGLTKPDPDEKTILLDRVKIEACVTLSQTLKVENTDATFEWRDDLLTEKQFFHLKIKTQNILYSVRTDQDIPEFVLQSQYRVDWDLKRLVPASDQIYYLSTHEDRIDQALVVLKPYENTRYHLKLCPFVETWQDLKKGYEWQQQDPKKRNFLPRSKDGRWDWFRLLMKNHQSLNFVRIGEGSSLDQPTLWQWLSTPQRIFPKFSAVLGSPVRHSYSASFHKEFFQPLNIPFFKIQINEEEWNVAIKILENWGLAFAAVTSPLKNKAGELVGQPALNTLVRDFESNRWKFANTDHDGFKFLFQNLKEEHVVVWGGGGLLHLLKSHLPRASFYSARSGVPREGSSEVNNPDVIIWASGPSDIHAVPSSWKPSKIIDLSYIENSVARELALKLGCLYRSGLGMFLEQAHAQQKFWSFFTDR